MVSLQLRFTHMTALRPQVPGRPHWHPTPLQLQLPYTSPPGSLLHPYPCTPRSGARCLDLHPRAAGPPRSSSQAPPRTCLCAL
jgi:hypothetical protein